mmetsp:Transcript_8101/g.23288  ORF Transcript_8101/g.23288 Transcript_8101/m.23288 type:complete len:437 (-) Transcript_8101:113-1423(-)
MGVQRVRSLASCKIVRFRPEGPSSSAASAAATATTSPADSEAKGQGTTAKVGGADSQQQAADAGNSSTETYLHDYCEANYELTDELIDDIWWQPEDFHQFKVSAKVLADEAIEKGICRYLDRNYGYVDDKSQNALNLWAKCRVTRRGLERFINKEYAQKRLDVRQRTIHAVLYTQQQMHEEIQCGDVDRAVETIRNVAVVISEQCQTFAYMMAKADASAGALRVRKRQKSASAQNVSDITEPTVASTSVTSQSSTASVGSSRVRPTISSHRRRVRRTHSGSSSRGSVTSASVESTHHDAHDDAASVPSVLTNVTEISKPRARASGAPPKSSQRVRPKSRQPSSKGASASTSAASGSGAGVSTIAEHIGKTTGATNSPSPVATAATTTTSSKKLHKTSLQKFLPPTSPTMSQHTQPVSVCSSDASATGNNLPTIIQF